MADPIYELLESPVYNTAIRAVQDSDPALASAIFTPLFTAMLNNTHFVKLMAEQVAAQLSGHVQDKQNPHGGTAAQLGADPAGSAAGVQNSLNAFAARRDNPHGVTAAQVGALPLSGGRMTGPIDMGAHGLTDVDRIRFRDTSTALLEFGVDMTMVDKQGRLYFALDYNIAAHQDIHMLLHRIRDIAGPVEAGDATNKQYVDSKTLVFTDKAISSPAWSSNSSYSVQGYHWRAGVACAGVTADHRPDVAFDIADAVSGNFAPVADSYTGGVFIYCKTKPATTVTVRSIVCIKGV